MKQENETIEPSFLYPSSTTNNQLMKDLMLRPSAGVLDDGMKASVTWYTSVNSTQSLLRFTSWD